MVEFTGERVIPGQVEVDLWNEHVARYLFAARRAASRRVLDAGCGSGYGAAELARTARAVVGIDAAADAVRYAREHYSQPNLVFLQASCAALPLAAGSVDLVVAFEVIEHLADWRAFLAETRRALAGGGELIISTPNKEYYAESRRLTGPNPFHVHEFEFAEFAAVLRNLFPHVTLFLENHVEGIGFQPVQGAVMGGAASGEGRVESHANGGSAGLVGTSSGDTAAPVELDLIGRTREPAPEEAHFLLAVCSLERQAPARAFLYLPSTANILRERELHIERLEGELATKNGWLEQLREEKQSLVEMFRNQKEELERSNGWAEELDTKLRSAQDRILELQEELKETTAGYEAKIVGLEEENRSKIEWARGLEQQLEAKGKELVECVRLLDRAESTVEERTAWAQRLEAQLHEVEAQLSLLRASRWLKLGRTFGLGPVLPNQ